MSDKAPVNEDGFSPPSHIITITIIIGAGHMVRREWAVGVSNRVWFHS